MVKIRNYDYFHMLVVLAKDYAKAHGYTSGLGGWIYRPNGKTVAQGWSAFYNVMSHRILDEIVVARTSYPSYISLIADTANTPTFDLSQDWRLVFLAFDFNHTMAVRKESRRAKVINAPAQLSSWMRAELGLTPDAKESR